MIFVSYLASIDNFIVDYESRIVSTDTEWSLSEKAFHRIAAYFDLFASIINAKCPDYMFSILDSGAIAIDAFTLS